MNQTISISLDPAGNIAVQGNVASMAVVHMMLGVASDNLRDHFAKQAASPIVIAPPGLRLMGPNGTPE